MRFIAAVVLGLVTGVAAYWAGGWLFPNSGDLGDIAQGFLRLGLGLLGVIVGIVLGVALTRRRGYRR
jgi:hypothetical protein